MKVTLEGSATQMIEHCISRAERCHILMRRRHISNSAMAARVNVPGVVMSHRRVSDVLRPNQPMDSMGRSMSGKTRDEILAAIEAVLAEEGE